MRCLLEKWVLLEPDARSPHFRSNWLVSIKDVAKYHLVNNTVQSELEAGIKLGIESKRGFWALYFHKKNYLVVSIAGKTALKKGNYSVKLLLEAYLEVLQQLITIKSKQNEFMINC